MRIFVVFLLLAVVAALPAAAATQQVSANTPGANVDIHGTSTGLDTSKVAPASPGLVTNVQTRDVHAQADGSQCAVDPNDHSLSRDRASRVCNPGQISTDASPSVVDAQVHLILPSPAATAAPAAAPAKTQAVMVEAAPSVGHAALVAAAAASVSALALYGIWRLLKVTGLAALLPLYSHLTDDEILVDANRSAIYRLIQDEPGISTKDIADRLGLAWGTVTHHLAKLEKRRFVVSKKYGKYRRFFANGEGGSQQKDALAVLRVDRTGDVAALISNHPGMTQKAVSEALGVSSSTILWHVKRLEEVHLVTKVREGKLVRYYPAEGMVRDLIPAAHAANAA